MPNFEPRFCTECGGPTALRVIKDGEPARSVCSACGWVHYTGPKLAAGLICRRGDRILLVQRGIEPGYGKWVSPGGFVDLSEHPADAALREAREEAGVEAALVGLVGVYFHRSREVVVVVYAAEVDADCEPEARDETLAVRWVRETEIPWDDLAFETTRLALRDYLSGTLREVSR